MNPKLTAGLLVAGIAMQVYAEMKKGSDSTLSPRANVTFTGTKLPEMARPGDRWNDGQSLWRYEQVGETEMVWTWDSYTRPDSYGHGRHMTLTDWMQR